METKDPARQQALNHLASIKEMAAKLKEQNSCEGAGTKNCPHDTDMMETIQEHALEVEVRSGWIPAAEIPFTAEQYRILLCTGGPAVRIKGSLDEYGQPATAQLEYQDWGTPWTRLDGLTREDIEALTEYASCFYYGD